MKFNMPADSFAQPDPFIFAENNNYYIFATGDDGVHLFKSETLTGKWSFLGSCCSIEGCTEYWAPSIIKFGERYYLYFSCRKRGVFYEYLYVASSDCVEGPYRNEKRLYDRFTIDSHVVDTKSGLFLFYAENNFDDKRKGTRIYVDRLLNPEKPANICKEIVKPSFSEEISAVNQNGIPGEWYTLEGPFWFCEGKYQYLMYSGGAYVNDTYHVGYCVADASETDLLKVNWEKHSASDGAFSPVLIKNKAEEGTGHNSVIKVNNQYYIVYHGRDYGVPPDKRTARFRKMFVHDGVITIE